MLCARAKHPHSSAYNPPPPVIPYPWHQYPSPPSLSLPLPAADVSGEVIAELGEDVGQFLVPRGRFVIELFPTFMRLLGKTYDFKVAYRSISRMFYLERPSPTPGEKATRWV